MLSWMILVHVFFFLFTCLRVVLVSLLVRLNIEQGRPQCVWVNHHEREARTSTSEILSIALPLRLHRSEWFTDFIRAWPKVVLHYVALSRCVPPPPKLYRFPSQR